MVMGIRATGSAIAAAVILPLIEALIVTFPATVSACYPSHRKALTRIVRFLALVVLMVLEGVHKQRTSYQTGTTCEKCGSHTGPGLLGRTLLHVYGLLLLLRRVRAEPACQHAKSACQYLLGFHDRLIPNTYRGCLGPEEDRRTVRGSHLEVSEDPRSTHHWAEEGTDPTAGEEGFDCSHRAAGRDYCCID